MRVHCSRFSPRPAGTLFAVILTVLLFCIVPRPVLCEEIALDESETEDRPTAFQKLSNAWYDWPPSENLKITLEYRNYTYFEGESRGDSRDSISEGRFRIEYDKYVRDNLRIYINGLFQADDDDFTHGFVDDFEDDDIRRNYFNFPEAFLDIYFDDFDIRLGKQIVKWGKADAFNPTDNVTPTDYSNLPDEDDIGVVAASLSYYWRDWSIQLVGVPGFTPTRLPPRGTRFSLIPPDSPLPVEDPQLPANTIENSQFGVRVKTTFRGWDFSVSYYDGVNDVPAPSTRYVTGIFPFPVPVSIVPIYHRYRAVGGDFATTFDRWGVHGEIAHLEFDGRREDSRLQYVIGFDYTRSNILFDHDLFVIVEYIGEHTTEEGTGLDVGTPLDRLFMSAVATRIEYEFTEYTSLEIEGAVDFYQGNDYFIKPQLVHEFTDNLEVRVGLDIIDGPKGTFFGQFQDNDRFFVKLKYTF